MRQTQERPLSISYVAPGVFVHPWYILGRVTFIRGPINTQEGVLLQVRLCDVYNEDDYHSATAAVEPVDQTLKGRVGWQKLIANLRVPSPQSAKRPMSRNNSALTRSNSMLSTTSTSTSNGKTANDSGEKSLIHVVFSNQQAVKLAEYLKEGDYMRVNASGCLIEEDPHSFLLGSGAVQWFRVVVPYNDERDEDGKLQLSLVEVYITRRIVAEDGRVGVDTMSLDELMGLVPIVNEVDSDGDIGMNADGDVKVESNNTIAPDERGNGRVSTVVPYTTAPVLPNESQFRTEMEVKLEQLRQQQIQMQQEFEQRQLQWQSEQYQHHFQLQLQSQQPFEQLHQQLHQHHQQLHQQLQVQQTLKRPHTETSNHEVSVQVIKRHQPYHHEPAQPAVATAHHLVHGTAQHAREHFSDSYALPTVLSSPPSPPSPPSSGITITPLRYIYRGLRQRHNIIGVCVNTSKVGTTKFGTWYTAYDLVDKTTGALAGTYDQFSVRLFAKSRDSLPIITNANSILFVHGIGIRNEGSDYKGFSINNPASDEYPTWWATFALDDSHYRPIFPKSTDPPFHTKLTTQYRTGILNDQSVMDTIQAIKLWYKTETRPHETMAIQAAANNPRVASLSRQNSTSSNNGSVSTAKQPVCVQVGNGYHIYSHDKPPPPPLPQQPPQQHKYQVPPAQPAQYYSHQLHPPQQQQAQPQQLKQRQNASSATSSASASVSKSAPSESAAASSTVPQPPQKPQREPHKFEFAAVNASTYQPNTNANFGGRVVALRRPLVDYSLITTKDCAIVYCTDFTEGMLLSSWSNVHASITADTENASLYAIDEVQNRLYSRTNRSMIIKCYLWGTTAKLICDNKIKPGAYLALKHAQISLDGQELSLHVQPDQKYINNKVVLDLYANNSLRIELHERFLKFEKHSATTTTTTTTAADPIPTQIENIKQQSSQQPSQQQQQQQQQQQEEEVPSQQPSVPPKSHDSQQQPTQIVIGQIGGMASAEDITINNEQNTISITVDDPFGNNSSSPPPSPLPVSSPPLPQAVLEQAYFPEHSVIGNHSEYIGVSDTYNDDYKDEDEDEDDDSDDDHSEDGHSDDDHPPTQCKSSSSITSLSSIQSADANQEFRARVTVVSMEPINLREIVQLYCTKCSQPRQPRKSRKSTLCSDTPTKHPDTPGAKDQPPRCPVCNKRLINAFCFKLLVKDQYGDEFLQLDVHGPQAQYFLHSINPNAVRDGDQDTLKSVADRLAIIGVGPHASQDTPSPEFECGILVVEPAPQDNMNSFWLVKTIINQ
ncbi:hypothetical protein GQ42DRAFT_34696 [Ramicandelaber brevisporus]|nr:hypothetical protein GQ42DRAFT_34696 [Ramicandelaber brevisporus]